jgi:glutathione synthase/RimK-type ligase-like ATP-grasp enzyme
MAVAQYLTHHKVPFTDANDVLGTAFDKISQMVKFALNNITVPDTLAVWPRTTVVDVQQFTQLPFIMKSNDGIKGLNNYLVQSWDEFETLLQAHGSNGYLVQPFIPNDGDYRFLYIGNELLAFFRQAQGKTHLNNSSQGGTGSLVEIPTCDPAVVRIAQQAMQCYAREISGVDVLVDKTTNKPYILEVNYTPAIPSGLFQEEKIKCYAQFVQTKIKGES